MDKSIYEEIASRCKGDIYIGVVGPVRTGKSTFIHKLLEGVVIPNIENEYDKERALDSTPQSGSGKAVMTTEPKFVPDDAVKINMDNTELNVKLIDCVGYMVDGAFGGEENRERMVKTPWSDEEMPFSRAAEIGTKKVISEHSTIAVLVTSDGSFGEIPRESFVAAEERVARELKENGKPFCIVLNSNSPESEEAHTLAEELESKYGVGVALVNCTDLEKNDFAAILSLILSDFPIRKIEFKLPRWVKALPEGHPMLTDSLEKINSLSEAVMKLGDINEKRLSEYGFEGAVTDAKDGLCRINVPYSQDSFFTALSEISGLEIHDECDLMKSVKEMARTKKEYEKIEGALNACKESGYGIVMPEKSSMEIGEPKLVKRDGAYGVKISASGESIHMIKLKLNAEFAPTVGSEAQAKDVLDYLVNEYLENPMGAMEGSVFGRSLSEHIDDGMKAKLENMPEDSRKKLATTLEKIMNEGANGLVCILL